MSVLGGIRAGRKAVLREHRRSVFEKVFSLYIGTHTPGDISLRESLCDFK